MEKKSHQTNFLIKLLNFLLNLSGRSFASFLDENTEISATLKGNSYMDSS